MTDHEQQWLARYGADYPNAADRAAAYRLHSATLQEIRAIFDAQSQETFNRRPDS